MHFRLRKGVVQVVRTTYDPTTKKPRTEIVARLSRGDPNVDPELVADCTPAEVEEMRRWIASQMRADAVAVEHAARSLPAQIARAAEWFGATDDEESARLVAAEAQQQWAKLRAQLRRRGLL